MGLPDRVATWFRELSTVWAGVLATLAVAVVVGGALAGYRTWDWVEHDNEFCLSCHLMVEPFDRFARSAHRGLGCKACHKPTFVGRSRMALAQVIENPEEISVHAEVENEKCVSCHIEGDPEEWETIENSAGHRIHFESDDPTLEGLKCVECHSTGIHEFTASDQTCGQSGCHEDVRVRLGDMADLTIHCAACHSFNAVADTLPEAFAEIRPEAEECLACHAMRQIVEMPPEDPHEGACAACHNPHEQTTPAQAVESCAVSGCHDDAPEVTPFHRGLDEGVLPECMDCHQAHDFSIEGDNCLACHQDIFEGAAPGAPVAGVPEGHPSVVGMGAVGGAADPAVPREAPGAVDGAAQPLGGVRGITPRRAGLALHRPGEPGGPSPPADPVRAAPIPSSFQAAPVDSTFRHGQHREVECTNCHVTEESHGAVTVTSLRDCRSCHHTAPVSNRCATCHAPASAPDESYRMTRSLSLTVASGPVRRALPFDHGVHAEEDCASCHTEGLGLSAETVACNSCHEEHHEPDRSCMSCHVDAPDESHPVEQVHVGCTGQGCHEPPLPIQGVPRTREVCLTCHQDLTDHRPGRDCAECHQLPDARGDR